MILRGGLHGVQRIARHLWRMCVALLIAMFSFFLGQQQLLPESVRGSFWPFVPEILVLGLMIFWLCRVFFTNAFRTAARISKLKKKGRLSPPRPDHTAGPVAARQAIGDRGVAADCSAPRRIGAN